jgi:Ca2+-binding RTX toxin-like protein
MDQGLGTAVQAVTLTVNGAGDNTITGTNAALTVDTITGGAGDDTISALAGADVIAGGAGVDTMTGGAGADRFNFADAQADTGITLATADVITDFVTGSDQIDIGTANAGIAWVNNTTVGGVNIATTAVADYAAALIAANVILTGTVDQYAFQFDGTNGYLFIDDDGTAGADQAIVLTGIDNTEFAFGDIIA